MAKDKHSKKLKVSSAFGSATLKSNVLVFPITLEAISQSQFIFALGNVPLTFNESTTLIPIVGANAAVARFNEIGDEVPKGKVINSALCAINGYTNIYNKNAGAFIVSALLNLAAFLSTVIPTNISTSLKAQVVYIPNKNFCGEIVVGALQQADDDSSVYILSPITFNAPGAGHFEIRVAYATDIIPTAATTALVLANSEFTVTQIAEYKCKH